LRGQYGSVDQIYNNIKLFSMLDRGTPCPIPALQKIEYLRMNDTILHNCLYFTANSPARVITRVAAPGLTQGQTLPNKSNP
jgi:hypothetical protein